MGFYEDHCIYLPAMLGWFVFSAALSSYNKFVFGSSHMAFPCPLFLTSIHFFTQWIFSYGVTQMFSEFHGSSRILNMDWKTFLAISIPVGLVTCGDVGLSNLALVRITITFYTMIKASSPIFVVASAFFFGIEKIRCSLIGVVLIISCGEFLTVLGEVNFDAIGLMLCLSASVLSGLRWTVVQLKLSKIDPPLKTTLATMRVLSPTMFFGMAFLSMVLERPWNRLGPSAGVDYFIDFEHSIKTLGIGFSGAAIAICMLMCEFHLIMKSNAIVLMIGGVLKEMVTILVGVYAFNDQLNLVNVGGCFVVFLGVVMYKVSHHIQKMEEKAFADANKIKVEYEPIRINLKKKHPNAAVTDADAAAGGGGSVSIDEYLLADEMGRQEFVPYDDDNTENGDDVDMDLEFAEDNGQWDRISRLRVVDDSEFELPVNARIT